MTSSRRGDSRPRDQWPDTFFGAVRICDARSPCPCTKTRFAGIFLLEVGADRGLDELMRHGARQVIQPAIEARASTLPERFENVKPPHGQRAVVCNDYLPERAVLTAARPIPVKYRRSVIDLDQT